MPFPSPLTLEQDLRDTFIRYIDTAFALRDERLQDERRQLLLSGQSRLFTPMLLEPVVPYDGTASISEIAADLHLDEHVLQRVARAVFNIESIDTEIRLRHHQVEALRVHLRGRGDRTQHHRHVRHGVREDGGLPDPHPDADRLGSPSVRPEGCPPVVEAGASRGSVATCQIETVALPRCAP